MHPVLFEAGGFTLYTYGALLAAAYLIGLRFALVRARRRGLDAARVMDLGIWIIVSALIGAKVLLVVVDWPRVSGPASLLGFARAGGVFYGGLIAAVATGIWYVRRYGLPIWSTGDVFAPAIALGHVVGRFGCLMAGCCYGRPTSMPWGITFHSEAAAANVGTVLGVPLHPTQLYDAGAELLILVFLLWSEKRTTARGGRAFAGRTFWSYILLYGAARFIIEFYRGDARGMIAGVVSTSQFVALLLVPIAVFMLIRLHGRTAPIPDAGVRARAA
jgi:phosphatidylglycerol:prolipoprotein diacylglycerol transferase